VCGFCGFLDTRSSRSAEARAEILVRMADRIRHRGPDDAGYWQDPEAGIGLGHRRLSIIDLSAEGHQPMLSRCGRYVIAFNGEIYNYRDIRHDLEKDMGTIPWRGHSDTEVMLAAIARWGLRPALERFNGMFAFALWDRKERALHLARDRLGEKPMYYGWSDGVLLFGSELKALRAHPAWRGEIDRDVLAVYARYNYVPAPRSIYGGISKLRPGNTLSIVGGAAAGELPVPVPFWSARLVAESGVANPVTLCDTDAISELDRVLRDAVSLRMAADVPLGAFLSGGVDSSTVVALMQSQSTQPIKTFSIGFHEKAYDEAAQARAVARYLGTNHTDMYVQPEQAMAVIPLLPALFDEPFADASQIPTYLVACLARQHVSVALSGDGGDELFAGYNRYFWGGNLWRVMRWLPYPTRAVAANAILALKPTRWSVFFATLSRIFPGSPRLLGDKLQKLAGILGARDPQLMYEGLVTHWPDPENLVIGARQSEIEPDVAAIPTDVHGLLNHMMYQDLVGYLPDDILVKVDRASMGISLEARVPLLDHRVVEYAWRLPMNTKIRPEGGKWILRRLLHRYVPSEMVERPKMGFAVPIDDWLRGPLREWAECLLAEERLRRDSFFVPGPIRQKWQEHLSGLRNWQYHLWGILMFQSWLDAERGDRIPAVTAAA
jgi:asparagine synthase (glutamine-hydrolysing)